MNTIKTRLHLLILLFILVSSYATAGAPGCEYRQDTLKVDQELYNGKLWRNLYSRVIGHQFFFTPDFITGNIFIGNRTFTNVPVKYDEHLDELVSFTSRGIFIQLNKEHIDSFSLLFNNRTYRFINIFDSIEPHGYMRVLYKGKTMLCLKYKKKIDVLSVDGVYDSFYETSKMYFMKDNKFYPFKGKMELYKLFGDRKKAVAAHVRKASLNITRDDPESFVPVIQYYDSITK